MHTITTVVPEVKPAVDLAESRCGGIDVALPGANTEREDSEPPTPKKSMPNLPKLIKEEEEEEDDPLTYLTQLFDLATLDDYEDSDSEDDESAPSSPRPKGFEKFYFYAASGRIHFYDNFRNVYREDGALVHDGSFDFPLNELFSPSFYIDGVPYRFDLEGLSSNDVHGTPYRVLIWQCEPDLFDLGQYVDQASSQAEPTVYPPNLNPTSYHEVAPASMTMAVAGGYYSTPKTKSEVLSPNVHSNSLQQALQGRSNVPWSPGSSTQKSPIVSVASREPSEGPTKPSLFHESQPVMVPIIEEWKEQIIQAQKDAAKARPVTKPTKEERRRCPECNKLFRRPSSLDDHLNVHSGHKPHTCPFKGCKTGFATKSNMKRHFLTHRVGPLERYRPGVTQQISEPYQLSPTKTGKAPRATSTYNSKAHHTMRFRIA